ncbi:MAG: glycosyltransferase family 39 protein [Candidatus Omnitrophica bacterium]|nr:glycosyltransferase family 39 protein [Candidatus Omnitrophota bacterium]
MTRHKAIAAALVAGGIFLRIWGIRFGPYYPDEPLVIHHAMGFGTGDLNPHMFFFPSLFLYMVFGVIGGLYGALSVLGRISGPEGFLNFYLLEPERVFLCARLLSVFFGGLTLVLVYRFGKAMGGSRAGLWSCALLSAGLLHVRDSHFGVTDVTLAFFMTWSLYCLWRFADRNGGRDWLWAAVLAGVAAAIKYNAFIIFVPIAAALWLERWPREVSFAVSVRSRIVRTGVTALVMCGVFFVLSPFVFIDHAGFVRDVGVILKQNLSYHLPAWHHARHLFWGMGPLVFVFAILGVILCIRRFRPAEGVLVMYLVIYYLMIQRAGQPFQRYVIGMIPLMTVMAGIALDASMSALAGRGTGARRAAVLLGVLVIGSCATPAVYSDILMSRKDTRALCGEWIMTHAPDGSVVAMDDPMHLPQLPVTRSQIQAKIQSFQSTSGALGNQKNIKLQALGNLNPYPYPSYELYYLHPTPSADPKFVMYSPQIPFDSKELERIGVEFLVASEASLRANPSFYAQVIRNWEQVAVFDPRRSADHPIALNLTYMPIDPRLFNYKRTGPLIYVYSPRKPK